MMTKGKMLLFISLLFASLNALAQNIQLYPTNWWVNMKWNKVQILVHTTDSSFNKSKVTVQYPGVKITKVHQLDNPKFLAVDVTIAPGTKPGNVALRFANNGKTNSVNWPLKARRTGVYAQGVTSKDLVYLIMPDRFSNGDPSNDRIPGLRDQSLNRDSIYHRHGGDLQGIINHLDYLQSLGVTTLWMTPVIENDQPNRTEHGYAFTNHYKIEPRLGGEAMYKKLSDELHKRGMKLIQDAVYNHVGSMHIFHLDQPTKDWFHQWPSYTGTTYKDQPIFDPYASKADFKRMVDGWFTPEMPDVNQSNPYHANFLIQHALWSVEEFGVDGWRIDTYIYNDLAFMNRCNAALLAEYPKMTMFGETWIHGTAAQAYFTENNLNIPFKSNLQGATDFQALLYGILPGLKDKFGWTDGINKLYQTLSNDFLYKDASRHNIFLDNHDLTRIASELGENVGLVKMALGWLYTCRGIPQLYYGTEVFMKGAKNPHDGWVRLDFPGGWAGDKKNGFTSEGLSADEKAIFELTKKLGNYRKNTTALQTGKMMQYVPEDALYVYFRYDAQKTVMCVMNTNDQAKEVNFNRFKERTDGFSGGVNIVDGTTVGKQFSIPAKTMYIIELQK